MSNPHAYTVAWICAVSTERVAAEAFLDEEHELPTSVSPHDNNSYKLGKVGRHMVVMAVLPDGEYGTASTARVASDLLHSFPNVRIGLMVGIGGGAPSQKHDIRLGDIVVGATRGGKSSVLQYDFGKAIQNQPLELTGFLNQAPPSLRTAVSGLKSHYEGNGHTIQEAIEKALSKRPRLRKNYRMPGHKNDRLYQSHIIHQDGPCRDHCGNDETVLISRPQRTDEDDDPTVHYGVIASADKLMKDATIRDRLAREHDVLCFEMEAAGLMNHFPCLIIRGICDYSDTHKNDQWQGYAAMVAAAYAKDLLLQIVPSSIENERKIADIMSELKESVDDVVEELKPVSKFIQSKHERDILEWLTVHEYAISHSDIFTKAEPGTGQWFLDSYPFREWLNNDKQRLLCCGNPGTGKTVITSLVVHHLFSKFQQSADVGIAYIYCNYQRHTQQGAIEILSSLLKQLAQTRSPLPKSVQDLYGVHEKSRTRPTFDQVSKALFSVSREYSKVFIVIDALDECNALDSTRATVLKEVFHLQDHATANVFATSRPNMEVSHFFNGSLSQDISATNDDIERYLNRQMSLNESLIIDDQLRLEVNNKVVAAADGMFLLARLQISTLLSQPTRGDLLDLLNTLNKGEEGLDEHYSQAMKRIHDQEPKRKALGMKILTWVVHSTRPLTMRELKHALAVHEIFDGLNEDYIPSSGIILSLCAGLVILDEESTIVRLVHYTTQEYFKRMQDLWFKDAEDKIAITCGTYLSLEFLHCKNTGHWRRSIGWRHWPLYGYAFYHWQNYLWDASACRSTSLLRFIKSRTKVFTSTRLSSYQHSLRRGVAGLHLAAYFGLSQVASFLIDSGIHADEHDIYGRTPLSYAAGAGRDAIVKLLLETRNVDPNSSPKAGSFQGVTPLMFASLERRKTVVDLLLSVHDIDINAQDAQGETALCHAVVSGNIPVGLTLLGKGADTEIRNNEGHTVLDVAVGEGDMTKVKFLLDNSANPNPKTTAGTGSSPLTIAVGRGDADIVGLLLDNGADPYLRGKGGNHMLPLCLAIRKGDATVTKVLLQRGIDPEGVPKTDRTPFSWAAAAGNVMIAKLLLDTGKVDPDSKSITGRTPLSYAAACGHEAMVELLLGTCTVNPDSRAEEPPGMTPLGFACSQGRLAIVKVLLNDTRVDPDSRLSQEGKGGPTELFRAAWYGREAIVRLLLDTSKVNVNSRDTNGWTPLDYAKNNSIRHMLREKGAKRGRDF